MIQSQPCGFEGKSVCINVHFDAEVRRYYATSDVGIFVEADTVEGLMAEVGAALPELVSFE